MLKFNVPFLPDPGYMELLGANHARIDAIYFSLLHGPVLDSRLRFHALETEQLAGLLSGLTGPSRYCLLNTRMLHPDLYFDDDFFKQLGNSLEILLDSRAINGIVFCDFYLLNRLSREIGSIAPLLEAVPGINSMIDSSDKAFSCLDMIAETTFKLPGKITLDRGLNRNPAMLAQVSNDVRHRFPGMKIEVIANEGCLYQCPFKSAHDAHISLSNSNLVRERTWELNQDAGCVLALSAHPEKLFKSPFIRPEDVNQYEGIADVIKLGGRSLGAGFMKQTLNAYFQGMFDGNLLELLDASQWMAAHYHINNHCLGNNFFKSLTTCTKDCNTCDYCHQLLTRCAEKKTMQFKHYRDLL